MKVGIIKGVGVNAQYPDGNCTVSLPRCEDLTEYTHHIQQAAEYFASQDCDAMAIACISLSAEAEKAANDNGLHFIAPPKMAAWCEAYHFVGTQAAYEYYRSRGVTPVAPDPALEKRIFERWAWEPHTPDDVEEFRRLVYRPGRQYVIGCTDLQGLADAALVPAYRWDIPREHIARIRLYL